MTRRFAQRVGIGIAAMLVLVLGAGCTNPIDPPAATVGSINISADDVFDEAGALAELPDDPYGILAETNNALNADMVSSILAGQIASAIYEDQAARMGLALDDGAVADARAQLESSAQTADLPDDLLDRLARRTATRQLVEQHISSEQWWTDADVERYHELTKSQVCARHILVETEAEAEDLLDQLHDGADFAKLAEEHSIDQGTAGEGGNLGCQPRNTFVGPFSEALDDAQTGDLIGPVRTDAGVHVILVDEGYHDVPLDEARDAIESSFADPQGSGWAQFVLKTTKVAVNPRFGSWDPAAGQVVPPPKARAASSVGPSTVS